ncbi:MAG: GGDEF domain-containing protein [Candidatus Limnocylindrales bacterium]
MSNRDSNDARPGFVGDPWVEARRSILEAQRASNADQASADVDQSAADADQTLSDADQTASERDQTGADKDQSSSDRDQATSDREHDRDSDHTDRDDGNYEASRAERAAVSNERLDNRLERAGTGRDRHATADERDRNSAGRDQSGDARDTNLASVESESLASVVNQLEDLRVEAAALRARAAAERVRAAEDRANAARKMARLEAELSSAHLDELTGAYRREMGRLALSHEIDRARRTDGRFVVAFVDVDRLKEVNDRHGHAAGDRVLQTVVRTIRSKLRSFDPIIRYGGDEFVCGVGGTDVAEAERRFDLIGIAIEADARVGISVGLAALEPGDTGDGLTERADGAMLEVKAAHHAGFERG